MKRKNRIEQILNLLKSTGSEIVSHGLAPNPFGFCFERGPRLTKAKALQLTRLLDSLSPEEEEDLKRIVF